MKKIFSLCLALMTVMTLVAEDFDFSNSIPKGWTCTPAPNGFESPGRGAQFIANTTLTLAGATEVTEVKMVAAANVAGSNTIAVKVGNTTFGTTQTLAKGTDQNLSFTGTKTDGDVVVSITRASKSVWIKSISITGKVVIGKDTSLLDTTYVYDEPTTVEPTDSIGSNMAYEFVQNNIYVAASTGARTADYFSCNAGKTMTIVTSKPMKGITIDGYIKKDFDVEVSDGDVEFMDASENEVEGVPVLIVKNIDNDTLILQCAKQMRVYALNVYFEANPIDSLGGGGGSEEEEYNFDYEPTTPTDLTVLFGDSVMIYDYDSVYQGFEIYMWNDDYEADIYLYSNDVDAQTIVPVGYYPINTTYAAGSAQASPGGDDYYDYPCVLMTDFEYYAEYQEWYYSTAYYLQAGTVTIEREASKVNIYVAATTHYGSTITLGGSWNVVETGVQAITTVGKDVTKSLHNGRLVIIRNNKHYNALGAEVR